MSSDESKPPENATPAVLTKEQQTAEQDAAVQAFGEGIVNQLRQDGGQYDMLDAYIQDRIARVHFAALLKQIALQTGFDMAALHREFCSMLQSEAQRMSGPKVQLAVASAIRSRKQ